MAASGAEAKGAAPEPSPQTDFVAVHDGAMPDEFCARLVARFEASDKQVPGRTGHGVEPAKKLSTDITLDAHPDWHDALKQIVATSRPLLSRYFAAHHFALIGALSPALPDPRTGEIVGITADNWPALGAPMADALTRRLYRIGPVNLQRYRRSEGGYPHWHSETYPEPGRHEALHRVLFFMFYLNDVAEGGETEFYYQRLAIRPKRGRMVIAPAGFTHTHRGCVPRDTDKYIATSWVLFRRAEELYPRR